MSNFSKQVLGCAFIASGLLMTDAFAFAKLGQMEGQPVTERWSVETVAHGSHENCQSDKGGSHWHKRGGKSKRIICIGGKKQS